MLFRSANHTRKHAGKANAQDSGSEIGSTGRRVCFAGHKGMSSDRTDCPNNRFMIGVGDCMQLGRVFVLCLLGGTLSAAEPLPAVVEFNRDIRPILSRSEERRVGKECRSRSAPYH